MPARKARMAQRNRAALDLHTFNLQIKAENYQFLKALATAKGNSMAGYLDEILDKKRDKYLNRRLIQSEQNAVNSSQSVQ